MFGQIVSSVPNLRTGNTSTDTRKQRTIATRQVANDVRLRQFQHDQRRPQPGKQAIQLVQVGLDVLRENTCSMICSPRRHKRVHKDKSITIRITRTAIDLHCVLY